MFSGSRFGCSVLKAEKCEPQNKFANANKGAEKTAFEPGRLSASTRLSSEGKEVRASQFRFIIIF